MSANVAAAPMNIAFCRGCGAQMHARAEICPKCGLRASAETSARSRVVAVLLCFFLGGVGAHKFYLGKVGQGVLYLLFFWTFIPAVIALVEFFILLCMSDGDFAQRYP